MNAAGTNGSAAVYSRPWTPARAAAVMQAAAAEIAAYLPPAERDGLACEGWPVFPCGPDGRPCTAGGPGDATNYPDAVLEIWRLHPGAAIGVPTGARSGLVVVELDASCLRGLDGVPRFADLAEGVGDLPPTRTIETPDCGFHLYYRHPGEGWRVPCSVDELGPGVRVHGDGGYVILPPSRTAAGAYRCRQPGELADLPTWVPRTKPGVPSCDAP